MNDSTRSKDTVVIERTFDAPLNLIWQLWTQPEHFQSWYGPRGFSIGAQMDVRVGGKRLICMDGQTPHGAVKMWTAGEYLEIEPKTRLVYTESMSDENGNVLSPAAMGMPADYPTQSVVTVILEDLGGRTKMLMTHAGLPGGGGAAGAKAAWNQAFDKLAEFLPVLLKGT